MVELNDDDGLELSAIWRGFPGFFFFFFFFFFSLKWLLKCFVALGFLLGWVLKLDL